MLKNRLLEIRLKRGYKNAKDFADFLGVTNSMYSMLENNKRSASLETAYNIAQKLDLKIEDIWYL